MRNEIFESFTKFTNSALFMPTMVGVLIAILVIVKIANKGDVKERNKFYDSAEYTLGTVTKKQIEGPLGKQYVMYVEYEYYVNSIKYIGKDSKSHLDSKKSSREFNAKRKKGKFAVAYNSQNPQESLIRLDYPVNSEADVKNIFK